MKKIIGPNGEVVPRTATQRKVQLSIKAGLLEIAEGRFAEDTIKRMMIDLRPTAHELMKGLSEPPGSGYRAAMQGLYELCNYIAHPIREDHKSNPIMVKVFEMAKPALHEGGKQRHESPKEGSPELRPYTGEHLAGAFLSAAYIAMKSSEDVGETIEKCFVHVSDIALCMISVLQEAVQELQQGEALGMMGISSDNGFYNLYCRVASGRATSWIDPCSCSIVSEPVIYGVPVIMTRAEDIDGVVPTIDSQTPHPFLTPSPGSGTSYHEKVVSVGESFFNQLFETYRGDDGLLHLRAISG